MGSEDVLVEIHPRELRFLFEVKKQSTCLVHLVNKSDQYVAFKVKTTSPKRYCVRPNVGVILPLASCDFTVTMQAPKNAPQDLQTKDKFLVQTTAVPFGTADEDIVPAFFSKESDRYIEEKKLKVVLISMTQSQEEQPIIGVTHVKETVGVPVAEEIHVNEAHTSQFHHPLKASSPHLRESPATCSEIPSSVKERPTVLQDFLVPPNKASFTLSESASNLQETSVISVESQFSSTETSAYLKAPPLEYTPAPSEVPLSSDIESTSTDNFHRSNVTEDVRTLDMKLNNLEVKLEEAETLIKLRQEARTTIQERDKLRKEMVTEDVHILEMKLNNLEVKLEEAETLIVKLREEARTTIQERDKLRKEMVFLKRTGVAQGQSSTGFPLLFVIYMAVVGMSLGYLLHL